MTLPIDSRSRRPDVEGLRGLAVLLVVGFHAGVPWLSGAFAAVDVFFVLSGFFLGATIARQLVTDDRLDLHDLYARRIWRLLPMLVVVALTTLVSAMVLYAPIDRPAVAEHLLPVAGFIGNIVFAARGVNYFHAAENPLLHTWTLGVEWQLALIVPALVAWFAGVERKRAPADMPLQARREAVLRSVLLGLAVAGAASFLLAMVISKRAPMWAYFGPHTRLWSYAAGMAAGMVIGGGQSAIGSSRRVVGLAQGAGLAGVLASVLLSRGGLSYSPWIALAPVAGTLLILSAGAAASASPIGRLLSTRPMVAIGRVSFAWYLWHLPLMVLGAALVPDIGVTGRLVCGAIAFVMAVATRQWMERTIHDRIVPRLMKNKPLRTAAAVCGALAVVAVVSLIATRQYIARTEHRIYAAARTDRVQHHCWDRRPAPDCVFGNRQSRVRIALLGDSHADHWIAGLDRAGQEQGWRIEPHVKGGCPVSDFSGLAGGKRYEGCHRYREREIRRIIAQRPRAVILSSFDSYIESVYGEMSEYQVHEDAWTEGLRRTYARFSSAGIPVIVLRGTPRVPFDVPSCLSRRAAGMLFASDCTYSLDVAHIARARRAQDVAARGLDVRFVDMNDVVCESARCATMRDGLVLFTDDNHLTASLARSVGSELGRRIATALNAAGTSSYRRISSDAVMATRKAIPGFVPSMR